MCLSRCGPSRKPCMRSSAGLALHKSNPLSRLCFSFQRAVPRLRCASNIVFAQWGMRRVWLMTALFAGQVTGTSWRIAFCKPAFSSSAPSAVCALPVRFGKICVRRRAAHHAFRFLLCPFVGSMGARMHARCVCRSRFLAVDFLAHYIYEPSKRRLG